MALLQNEKAIQQITIIDNSYRMKTLFKLRHAIKEMAFMGLSYTGIMKWKCFHWSGKSVNELKKEFN